MVHFMNLCQQHNKGDVLLIKFKIMGSMNKEMKFDLSLNYHFSTRFTYKSTLLLFVFTRGIVSKKQMKEAVFVKI